MSLVTLTSNGHTRKAIRMPDGSLRAVPPMRDDLPRDVRVRIFQYVLAGQVGLADTLAKIEAEVIEGRERQNRTAARLLAQRPYVAPLDEGDDDEGTAGVLAVAA